MRDARLGPITRKDNGESGELIATVKPEESGGLLDAEWGIVVMDSASPIKPSCVKLSTLNILATSPTPEEMATRAALEQALADAAEKLAALNSALSRRTARLAPPVVVPPPPK
jgi:hypothetical protein